MVNPAAGIALTNSTTPGTSRTVTEPPGDGTVLVSHAAAVVAVVVGVAGEGAVVDGVEAAVVEVTAPACVVDVEIAGTVVRTVDEDRGVVPVGVSTTAPVSRVVPDEATTTGARLASPIPASANESV